MKPVTGTNPKTDAEEIRTVADGQPFTGLVFKIQADPHVGKLAYVRVYSGVGIGQLRAEYDQG